MKRFFQGLTFKTGIAVVLIQIIALTAIGIYYIDRFSGEIDQSMRARLQIPGTLMTQGVLSYEAANDRVILEDLIGESLIDSLVIGLNGQIFYALDPNDVGRNANVVIGSELAGRLDAAAMTSIQSPDGLVNITPLRLTDGKLLGFLYLKVGSEQLTKQKSLVTFVFILGSFTCVLATSVAIILLFRSIILLRIGKLLAVSQQVASGNMTARVNEPPSKDEIGILQHSINLMAAELEKTIGNLQNEIAERIKVGTALRESQQMLRLVIDHIPQNVFWKDRDLKFLGCNKSFSDAAGLETPEDIVGLSDLDLPWAEYAPKYQREDRQALESPVPLLNAEIAYTLLDGSQNWSQTSKVQLRNQQGQVWGILGISENITKRKQAEAQRELLIQELETKNAELERFTYTVSHDLKSPLITIKSFLGFLERDALAGNIERLRGDIGYIATAADKMHYLLEDLLELSRIGQLKNPPERISASELAREAAASVSGQLAMRGVQVVIAPDMPVIIGDRTRLREIWENLLVNAVKFMGDQSQPRIEVGARDDAGAPVFYVRDNGIGIEPQYQKKIFELFEKLDPESAGTGVGLTIVKRVVETHNGNIWVESKGAGRGSTFCFTLATAT